ncbi:unnamed protein product [Ceutorhynchus assimilis]|uniref:Uncharacterized protein n=1 Tax=Ceutorhynchus assimilis TaxID=467358 RepID=A0A9N9QQD9_9CUCU|nr:unnamed protein product [Ceutorhynchus assimilis]
MKFFYLIPLILTVALGYNLVEYGEVMQKQILKEEIVKLFKDVIQKLALVQSEIGLSNDLAANLNDYLDQLLPGINQAISKAGYDPKSLPDQSVSIVIGKSTLKEGTLSKLATIERYQNVTVSYDSDARKVAMDFILRWEDLQIIYKYHTKVAFVSITGHVTADVEHMKIHLKLGFDYNTNHITVDSLDFKHTGDISLKFSGHKIVDYITNAMTTVFTTLFHSLVLSEVKKITMDPVQDLVNTFNNMIDQVLHK